MCLTGVRGPKVNYFFAKVDVRRLCWSDRTWLQVMCYTCYDVQSLYIITSVLRMFGSWGLRELQRLLHNYVGSEVQHF